LLFLSLILSLNLGREFYKELLVSWHFFSPIKS
jgi:hypothetical protein